MTAVKSGGSDKSLQRYIFGCFVPTLEWDDNVVLLVKSDVAIAEEVECESFSLLQGECELSGHPGASVVQFSEGQEFSGHGVSNDEPPTFVLVLGELGCVDALACTGLLGGTVEGDAQGALGLSVFVEIQLLDLVVNVDDGQNAHDLEQISQVALGHGGRQDAREFRSGCGEKLR